MIHRLLKLKGIKLFLFVGLPLFTGSLLGCSSDLSDVQKLGERWEKISQSSEVIGQDFYQSCLRRANIPPSRYPEITSYKLLVDQDCVDLFRPASNNIISINKGLIDYLRFLAILADPSTGEITQQDREALEMAIKGLGSSLSDAGFTPPEVFSNEESVSLLVNFLDFIITAAQNRIRQNTIRPIMVCFDDEIEIYSKGLEEIASQVYPMSLEREKSQWKSYFGSTPPSEEEISTSSGILDQPTQRFINEIDKINERQEKGRVFADFLAATRRMHHDISIIFSEDKEFSSEAEKETYCQDFEKDLREEFAQSAIRKTDTIAESRNETDSEFDVYHLDLSAKQIREISSILQDYQTTTEPLLDRLNSTIH